MSSNKAFVKGAAILATAGLAARVIGAFFRVALAAILGDEGIGLYQYAYPIYSTLLVISTAGIPVALSKLMAERIALQQENEALRIFRVGFLILSLSGIIIFVLLFFGSEFIALYLVKDALAILPIKAISPAILFVTIMASLRGYFQGRQKMLPTASSQLLEQLVRVAFAIAMVLLFLPRGLEYAAAGATSGAAAGGLAGLLLLACWYGRERSSARPAKVERPQLSPGEPAGQILTRIMSLAIPVTVGGLVIPLLTLIDLAVVPRQLQAAGFDLETGRALYGQLTGMAGSVVYFPNVVALALSISLVPAISEAYALGNKELVKNRASAAIKLTFLFSLPAATGLFLLAEPVTVLLFANADAGFALSYLSWSVIPLCLYVTTTGLLQGLGRPVIPALNMFYGGLIKTLLAWFLTAIPSLNVGGAALASAVGVGVAAALNLYHVARLAGWRDKIRSILLEPGIALLLMAVVVKLTYSGLFYLGAELLSAARLNAFAVFTAIIAGSLVYGIMLLLLGVFKKEDLLLIPIAGSKLAGAAERFGLLKNNKPEKTGEGMKG